MQHQKGEGKNYGYTFNRLGPKPDPVNPNLDPPLFIKETLNVIWHFMVQTAEAKWRCEVRNAPLPSVRVADPDPKQK